MEGFIKGCIVIMYIILLYTFIRIILIKKGK